MLREFKDFIGRGNVLDLAVAFIIGVAFAAIINSLVNDIIMPIVGIIIGGVDFSSLSITVGKAVITYGNFIQAIVTFIIVAFTLFLIVKAANKMTKQKEALPAPPAPPSDEVVLLT